MAFEGQGGKGRWPVRARQLRMDSGLFQPQNSLLRFTFGHHAKAFVVKVVGFGLFIVGHTGIKTLEEAVVQPIAWDSWSRL